MTWKSPAFFTAMELSAREAGGVVAAGCPYTAEAAIFALEKGGNAIDAAIAAQLVAVCVVGKNQLNNFVCSVLVSR